MTGGTRPEIRILPDLTALSRAAADVVLSAAVQAVRASGRFTVALSGGTTPQMLYSVLASAPHNDLIPWQHIHIFWADERCVPPDHDDSNFRLAFETLLSRVPLPDENVHRIRGEAGPDRAAADYEQELHRCFGPQMPAFGLVLLGMGDDGHTASLFPHSPQLQEQDRLALPVTLGGAKHSRVTLSLPVLNNAAQVVFLVSGRAKADAVQQALQGAGSTLPAGQVLPVHGRLLWLLDLDAARRLEAVPGSDAKTVFG